MKHCGMGTYEHCVEVQLMSGKIVHIDHCIAEEIQMLDSMGIRTMASCCGHGKLLATVCVADGDGEKMEALGYVGGRNQFGALVYELKRIMETQKEYEMEYFTFINGKMEKVKKIVARKVADGSYVAELPETHEFRYVRPVAKNIS